jgi:hypothetical protein
MNIVSAHLLLIRGTADQSNLIKLFNSPAQ